MLILDSLRVIEDRRVDRTKRHSLELILFVAVCAYLCGCEGFNEMELFAEANGEWLRAGLGMSGKSNEITAIPQLMDLLDLKGCVVAADALNTQKAVEKGADWLLPLKGNHPLVEEEVGSFMGALAARTAPGVDGGSQKTYDKLF